MEKIEAIYDDFNRSVLGDEEANKHLNLEDLSIFQSFGKIELMI